MPEKIAAYMIPLLAVTAAAWILARHTWHRRPALGAGFLSIENLNNGVIVLDRYARIVDANPAAAAIVGKTGRALLGQKLVDVLPHYADRIDRALQRGEAREELVVEREGETRIYDLHLSKLTGEKVKTDGYLLNIREITESKRTQAALSHYAERLRVLHEIDQAILTAQSPETIAAAALAYIHRLLPSERVSVVAYDTDQRARLLAIRAADGLPEDGSIWEQALHLNGFDVDEIRHVNDLPGKPSPSPLERRLLEQGVRAYLLVPLAVQETLIGTLNIETTTPNAFATDHIDVAAQVGVSMAVALENARLYTAAREELRERESVEAALRESEQALREHAGDLVSQNAELDAFAHTVAHDLKNPLAILRGYATFLESGDAAGKEEMREVCRKIDESATKMSNIVSALLLLSKIRQSDEVELAPLDMVQITSEVLHRVTQLAGKHDAEIVLPETWPAALGYAPWIEEVWANYISNAIKYGGEPPRVELGATVLPASGDRPARVRFWVRDNGAGLTPEQQRHLFIPFERLDQARIKGDGLGLSIVHRIMNRLGGTAGVESSGVPGEGSTFYFELPAAS